MRMMNSVIILLVLIFSPAILLIAQSAQLETGVQLARSQTAIVGDIQQKISGSSTSKSSSPSAISGTGTSSGSLSDRDKYDRQRYIDALGLDGQQLRKISPHPLRYSCAMRWNAYYKKEEINIKVRSRGNYDQAVEFFCPTCYDTQHFVKPFLMSEYQGMTGLDRIKSCGFEFIIFRGGRGLNEVIIDVTDQQWAEVPMDSSTIAE